MWIFVYNRRKHKGVKTQRLAVLAQKNKGRTGDTGFIACLHGSSYVLNVLSMLAAVILSLSTLIYRPSQALGRFCFMYNQQVMEELLVMVEKQHRWAPAC